MPTIHRVLAGCALVLCLCAPATAAPIVYTDAAAWEAAVGTFRLETLDGPAECDERSFEFDFCRRFFDGFAISYDGHDLWALVDDAAYFSARFLGVISFGWTPGSFSVQPQAAVGFDYVVPPPDEIPFTIESGIAEVSVHCFLSPGVRCNPDDALFGNTVATALLTGTGFIGWVIPPGEPPIGSVRILFEGPVIVDNVRFAPVPEPGSTVLLLSMAFAVLILARRHLTIH